MPHPTWEGGKVRDNITLTSHVGGLVSKISLATFEYVKWTLLSFTIRPDQRIYVINVYSF